MDGPQSGPESKAAGSSSLWRASLAAQAESGRGFDGVLLFVAASRIFSPLLIGYNLYDYLRLFLQPNVCLSLFHPEYPAYNRAFAVYTLSAAMEASIFFFFDLALLWLFFGRRSAFRWAMIAFLLLSIAMPACVLWLSLLLGVVDRDALFYAGFSGLWALLWVPYFVYSDRVKNTFVR